MKISVERTGGFTGLTEKLGSLDTDRLPPAQKKAMEKRVRAVRFFQLPESLPVGHVGADLYNYRVTVADGSKQHTVTFVGEDPGIDAVRELVEAVIG